MNGELVDAEMYERRCSSSRGGYGIAVKDGLIFDCYEEYLRDCFISTPLVVLCLPVLMVI